MIWTNSERIAVFGASRGLGEAFCKRIAAAQPRPSGLFLSSRKQDKLEALREFFGTYGISDVAVAASDFSKPVDQERVLAQLSEWNATRVFYFAGGGPFGAFAEKAWRDHQWALEVSFLFPARLIHFLLNERKARQIVVIGSSIAEERPDPFAASYASAKHALRGLISSILAESPQLDLRLFSPGYMNTELLPAHAWPRQQGKTILEPDGVADELYKWACGPDEAKLKALI